MVASICIALGRIWYSFYCKLALVVEYSGISYFWFLVAREIYVDAIKFEWPCDVELSIADS